MSKVFWVEDESHFETLLETTTVPVVVDFTAPAWCVPCQKFAPHFEKAAEVSEDALFVAVDVDKAPWATNEYGVLGVPRVMLFVNGAFKMDLQNRSAVSLLNEIKFNVQNT